MTFLPISAGGIWLIEAPALKLLTVSAPTAAPAHSAGRADTVEAPASVDCANVWGVSRTAVRSVRYQGRRHRIGADGCPIPFLEKLAVLASAWR